MGPNWNWVEKRYKDTKSSGSEYYNSDKKDLGLAFNLTNTLKNEFTSRNGTKIVNWMIKNDGKQTIIVL